MKDIPNRHLVSLSSPATHRQRESRRQMWTCLRSRSDSAAPRQGKCRDRETKSTLPARLSTLATSPLLNSHLSFLTLSTRATSPLVNDHLLPPQAIHICHLSAAKKPSFLPQTSTLAPSPLLNYHLILPQAIYNGYLSAAK
ncbi:hypothetical protein J6590_024781 [Homalodisca vitripennis]|nr:hypothetical protein J6590_024781 [Homalodisca vitripennis]